MTNQVIVLNQMRPVSTNQMYNVTPQGKIFKTPKVKDFQKEIHSILKELKPPKLYGAISLTILFELRGARKKIDLDNMLKSLIDGIAPHICAIGDEQFYEIHVKKVLYCESNCIKIKYHSIEDPACSNDEFFNFGGVQIPPIQHGNPLE